MSVTLVCFAGAGATGKTTLVNALEKKISGAVIHRSIVREYYASAGVSSEADFLTMTPEDRMAFQLGLNDYFLTNMENRVAELQVERKSSVILSERSVFDHYAYTLYGSRELLGDAEMGALNAGVQRFKCLRPLVMYLPYPVPWKAAGADGFRAQEPAKDSIIDAVVHTQLSRNRDVWCGTVPIGDIEKRINWILWRLRSVVGGSAVS